jgi:hypothetical protein
MFVWCKGHYNRTPKICWIKYPWLPFTEEQYHLQGGFYTRSSTSITEGKGNEENIWALKERLSENWVMPGTRDDGKFVFRHEYMFAKRVL